jgi:hypothetical protein
MKKKPAQKPTNLVTRAELSRVKGVSRAAVTQAARPGGPLAAAVVGDQMDLDHPATAAWLAEAPRGDVSGSPVGSEPTRAEMLKAQLRKRQADASMLEAKLEILRARLIPRELVRTHVIGYIDGLCQRLLTDVPRTASTAVETSTKTGGTRIDFEGIIRDATSVAIQSAKATAIRKLQTIEASANPPAVAEPPDVQAEADASLVRSVGSAVTETLQDTAPTVVDRILRSVARESGPGGRFDAPTFERVLAALESVRADTTGQVRVMLAAAVDRALAVALRNEPATAEDAAE